MSLDKWPGAAAIENENGQIVNLRAKSLEDRVSLAYQLLAPTGNNFSGLRNKKVHRHLTNGDVVLMNRQPNDQDGRKDEYLTEAGLQFGQQRTHGVLTGITS